MNQQPEIGLVTVLFNGREVLSDFFESVANQTYKNFTVYVIDNSPDEKAINEARLLVSLYDIPTVFIKNEKNLGVAKGNNQGIQAALGAGSEYVLLLNNDIVFENDALHKMVMWSIYNEENIVVPKIHYHNTNKIWMAGGRILKYRGYTIHTGDLQIDNGQFDTICYTEYAPTCFMLVHKDVFPKVGLMDETYFVYFDDTDFITRCNRAGYRISYFPKVNISHKVSVSTGGNESEFTIYYGNRNRIYFSLKNLKFLHCIPFVLYYAVTRPLKLVKYNQSQKKALLKGCRDGFSLAIRKGLPKWSLDEMKAQ